MVPTWVRTRGEDHTLRTELSMSTRYKPDNHRSFKLRDDTALPRAVLSVRAQIEQEQRQQQEQQQQMLPAQRFLEVDTG